MMGARLWKRAVQLVYMLKQVRVNSLPERVKDNAGPFAASQFSRRHKSLSPVTRTMVSACFFSVIEAISSPIRISTAFC